MKGTAAVEVAVRWGQVAQADSGAATRNGGRRVTESSPLAVALFTAFVIFLVTAGWLLHERLPITPKEGVGYALGICGATTLLLQGVYSAQKRIAFLRRLGGVSQSFRIHMVLGVLGPIFVLFHSNFHFGAPNSNVALISMLVVAASGVAGRYIYTHISHGLYGARATLGELHTELDLNAHSLDAHLPPASRAGRRLALFNERARQPRGAVRGVAFRLIGLPILALGVRRKVMRELHADLGLAGGAALADAAGVRANETLTQEIVDAFIGTLVKESQFTIYERLFSLWHALHVPLFVMLIVAGVLHVIAVHMY
ncbi:MAG: hypothetical protein HY270_02445 [Deltaproteobacteria bacterium]|nr:hypothetical protein [Deltaproteobacteria bacterium]